MEHDIASQFADTAAQRANAALSYIRRGWAIVALHDVTMGYCSCGDTSEKHMGTSAGKHPLANRWQLSALRDEEIVRSVFAGRPGMNFGIQTGTASRCWVLDVDPKNGGDVALAELVKEHGSLPDTYSVRTGSGGVHYFWLLPDDFTPTNSPGSLPAGLDVRGEGGFVVAAPCRSGIGLYEVLLDLPLVGAPSWLLDMIRPRIPADREHQAAMAHWDSPTVALAGQNDRLVRYAYAAAMAELTELAQAPQGRRGWTAHKVACSLVELVNSPWSGISEETAKGWFTQATEQAMTQGGAFDQHEAWSAWGSAARKVGARGRAAPDVVAGGVLLGWSQLGGVPPFSGSPAGHSANGIGSPGGFLTGSPSVQQDWTQSPTPYIGPAQASNDLVQSIGPGVQALDPVDAMISTFLDSAGLANLPPPEWLIKDWIPLGGVVQTIGQPNHGKSFVTLDQAMHIALGRHWHGYRTQKARVGYLIAEGVSGMGQRVKAWEQRFHDGQRVEGITFIPYPVQASDHVAWETLILACRRLGFGYLVIDTQARVTVGMEENSAKEMGIFVEQIERLRRVTGATINIVHHESKAGGTARGSGAMKGAVNTEISVSKAADRVLSTVTKQKDAELAEPLLLQLVGEKVGERVVGGAPLANGWAINAETETLWSAVLVDVDKVDALEWEKTDNKGKILMLLRDIYPLRGATKAEAVAEAKRRGMVKQSAHWAWDQLLGTGLIAVVYVDDKATGRYVASSIETRTPTSGLD